MLHYKDFSQWKNVRQDQWDDWYWQMQNRIKDLDTLSSMLDLAISDRDLVKKKILPRLSMEISPHMILQIKRLEDSGQVEYAQALLQTVLPTAQEINVVSSLELKGEGMGTGYKRDEYPGLSLVLRRLYNDRLVFCLNFQCPVKCRYCFRSNEMGKKISRADIKAGFEYIANWNKQYPHDPIRDIIFTGGDPLSFSDQRLNEILQAAKAIEGVEILRIDTKYPAAMPQRITPELVGVLRAAHPLFMTLHFVHPGEFSTETAQACQRLADAGIPLGTYTPLLKGINDNKETLKGLFRECTKNRMRPYYLVHFIETEGAQHFKTPIEKGLEILDDLHGYISGIAIPQYIVYLPQGGGKVPLCPNYLLKKTSEGYWFRNWQDKMYLYPYPRDL